MKHLVFYSGGIGSYVAAKRVVAREPLSDVILLFTDTKSEDPDLYRFLKETTEFLQVRLAHLREGRDLWELFNDRNMMGNPRVDPRDWGKGCRCMTEGEPDDITPPGETSDRSAFPRRR